MRLDAEEFCSVAGWESSRTVALVYSVIAGAPLSHSEIHGFRHWLDVLHHGMGLVAEGSPRHRLLQRDVLALFALFHDSERTTEDACDEHGPAACASMLRRRGQIRSAIIGLNPWAVDLAAHACRIHTACEYPRDSDELRPGVTKVGVPPHLLTLDELTCPIVGRCLDADRMDLVRLGIDPNPAMLYTQRARDRYGR